MSRLKRLLIVGAGGFGRELLQWALEHPDHGRRWAIGGFLDDNLSALGNHSCKFGVVDRISTYQPGPDDIFLLAVGYPKVKKRCVSVLESRGAEFISLIHPQAKLGSNVSLGKGCIVCPFSVLSTHIQVGDYCAFYYHSAIGHDVTIGSWSQISAFADLTGGVTAGESLFMGTHASVLPGVTVGNEVTVGAGSVVFKDVPGGKTMFGNPARPV